MKLITRNLEQRFQEIGDQSQEKDPVVFAKFFNPSGAGTWYATEYNPKTKIAFGYAEITFGEWGSFSITEFENTSLPPFGLKIERDIHFSEKRFSELIKEKDRMRDLSQTKKENVKDKEAEQDHEI